MDARASEIHIGEGRISGMSRTEFVESDRSTVVQPSAVSCPESVYVETTDNLGSSRGEGWNGDGMAGSGSGTGIVETDGI